MIIVPQQELQLKEKDLIKGPYTHRSEFKRHPLEFHLQKVQRVELGLTL
jgi:hypothetical protein